ncbi:cytochrome P450 [Crepidotus variabilis]|uniref:Cytochrome P450 n=1 Tax=Crepidotus variabilis TaxID=179855 RepID=A0A9P6JQ74_9AGAR|nr:cytochrome P450 [Crepidotus variabilis]
MATCRELATDMKAMSKLREQYWVLEKNATPTALLLQLLPSSEEKNKLIATRDLHATMRTYVENRKGATPNSDAIDFLLLKGLKTHEAVEFAVNMNFLGLINTGSCCTLLYLSFHTEWKQKVAADVNAIIEKHTNTSSPEPLYKRLAAVPISAWDEEMPALELVLRETLRLTPSPTALRRNFQENLEINGKRIPVGNFVAYSLGDPHINPDIYTDPTEFDPTRSGPGREKDKKEPYDYLGWGGGRHPCLDIKFARLEIKIIVTLLLAGYEYDAVNERGGRPGRLPGTDFNDIHQPRPAAGDPCYLKFKRAVD